MIHNVRIEFQDASGAVVGDPVINEHVHTMGSYTYENAEVVLPTTPGEYRLVATSTNDAGELPTSRSVPITVTEM